MTQPLLLNFSHPFSEQQRQQLEHKLGTPFTEQHLPVHVQSGESMTAACERALAALALSATEWQTTPLIVNPPGLSSLACLLLTAIHGRCGYFPALTIMRPLSSAPLPTFVLEDVVNLQALREQSRQTRTT